VTRLSLQCECRFRTSGAIRLSSNVDAERGRGHRVPPGLACVENRRRDPYAARGRYRSRVMARTDEMLQRCNVTPGSNRLRVSVDGSPEGRDACVSAVPRGLGRLRAARRDHVRRTVDCRDACAGCFISETFSREAIRMRMRMQRTPPARSNWPCE